MRIVWPPLLALVIIKLRIELSYEKEDFWEGKRLDFCGYLLTKITLARRKQIEFSWSGEILLFLNECSTEASRSQIEDLEIQEKLRSAESTLRWDSVRGWEGKFATEFWTRIEMGRAERFKLSREKKFLFRIVLW